MGNTLCKNIKTVEPENPKGHKKQNLDLLINNKKMADLFVDNDFPHPVDPKTLESSSRLGPASPNQCVERSEKKICHATRRQTEYDH